MERIERPCVFCIGSEQTLLCTLVLTAFSLSNSSLPLGLNVLSEPSSSTQIISPFHISK